MDANKKGRKEYSNIKEWMDEKEDGMKVKRNDGDKKGRMRNKKGAGERDEAGMAGKDG